VEEENLGVEEIVAHQGGLVCRSGGVELVESQVPDFASHPVNKADHDAVLAARGGPVCSFPVLDVVGPFQPVVGLGQAEDSRAVPVEERLEIKFVLGVLPTLDVNIVVLVQANQGGVLALAAGVGFDYFPAAGKEKSNFFVEVVLAGLHAPLLLLLLLFRPESRFFSKAGC